MRGGALRSAPSPAVLRNFQHHSAAMSVIQPPAPWQPALGNAAVAAVSAAQWQPRRAAPATGAGDGRCTPPAICCGNRRSRAAAAAVALGTWVHGALVRCGALERRSHPSHPKHASCVALVFMFSFRPATRSSDSSRAGAPAAAAGPDPRTSSWGAPSPPRQNCPHSRGRRGPRPCQASRRFWVSACRGQARGGRRPLRPVARRDSTHQ